MASEHPQKQYRNGQDDGQIPQRRNLLPPFPALFQRKVHNFGWGEQKDPHWFIKLMEQLPQTTELQDETCC